VGERKDSVDRTPGVESEALERRRYGRVAGMLFILGSLGTVPSLLVREPPIEPTIFLFTLLACASGAICFLIPWERATPAWFHALTAAATLEVALVTGLADRAFEWFYVFVAVYAGYVFSSRRAIAAHLALVAAALLAPGVYDPDSANHALFSGLIGIPSLVIAAVIVAYLRERLEARESAYRGLAARDPLTGVGNYRSFRDHLAQEIGRHARTEREFALLIVDLDEFKVVNDRLGHLEGDHVLRRVGQALATGVRVQDIVARHGGDEFSVIAPETGASGATELAARVERAVGDVFVEGFPITASTGVAVFPHDGSEPEELVRHADAALRERKGEHGAARDPRPTPAGA
jgi:diguanylate cyclase (GGDEF)-like protein